MFCLNFISWLGRGCAALTTAGQTRHWQTVQPHLLPLGTRFIALCTVIWQKQMPSNKQTDETDGKTDRKSILCLSVYLNVLIDWTTVCLIVFCVCLQLSPLCNTPDVSTILAELPCTDVPRGLTGLFVVCSTVHCVH